MRTSSSTPPRWRWPVAAAAAAFGVATVLAGGRVVLGGAAVRSQAGAILLPVVWFNFLAGFAYLAAGAGIALSRRWSAGLAAAIAGATVAVSAAFAVHVAMGGGYETRTVAALAFRSAFWIAVALWAARLGAARAARSA